MLRIQTVTAPFVALLAAVAMQAAPAEAAVNCTAASQCATVLAAAQAAIEQACPCAQATSRKAYVKCAKGVLKLQKQQLGSKACRGAAKQGALNSTCGRSGFVPCNKQNKKGTKTACKVVKAAKCKGSACGAFTGCLDACNPSAQACATTTTTTTTPVSTTTTTTIIVPAGCCDFTNLSFTTTPGTGNCGEVLNSSGTSIGTLSCGGLYFGGGQNSVPLPALVPDTSQSFVNITSCDAGTGDQTLAARTAAETGSNLNCSATGCLFGAPLPIPNPNSIPTSTCVVNSITSDATGTANCGTGASTIALPLNSQIYLTGDLLPGVTGIQPCPLCTNGTCQGGPNDGLACTPGSTALNESYPTSHDCPPPAAQDIGGLPIAFNLTTGTVSRTAVATGTLARVFCGFCRDQTGPGTGTFEEPFRACATDTDCTDVNFPDCEQRDNGAFSLGAARTVTVTGTPAGDVTDGLPHDSTVVSLFCIPPTFNATVDNAGNLPGPGAVALVGQAQLHP
jgi:hypothetical protein